MKIKHCNFWQIKEILIFSDYKKKIVVLFFNSSSSITYILLNINNKAYFWHNVFKLNRTFIVDGLPCLYLI